MKQKTKIMWNVGLIVGLLLLLFVLEQILPSSSMLFTVLKKGAIYALVAVSMNLLNGFTGLFSLGQAGFMLLGAYAYGILTIPVESWPVFISTLMAELFSLRFRCRWR